MGYGHLHRLDLLVFGRDGADFVAHLVAFHRHVLALNAGADGGKEIQKLQVSSLALSYMQTFAVEMRGQQMEKNKRKWFCSPASSSNASCFKICTWNTRLI